MGYALIFWRDYGFTSSFGWYTGHYCSLSVEKKCYFFWPGLLIVVGSRRVFLPGLCLALGLDARGGSPIAIGRSHIRRSGSRYIASECDGIRDWMPRYYGCLLAIVLDRPACRRWATDHLYGSVRFVCIAAVVAIVAEARVQLGVASVLEAMAMPAMIMTTIIAPHTVLGRLLELKVFVWVGRLSYSIYLGRPDIETVSTASTILRASA